MAVVCLLAVDLFRFGWFSAAEKNGEFLVPLSEERLVALRQSIKIHRDQLDNNFLVRERTTVTPG